MKPFPSVLPSHVSGSPCLRTLSCPLTLSRHQSHVASLPSRPASQALSCSGLALASSQPYMGKQPCQMWVQPCHLCDGNQSCLTCQAGRLREESMASEGHPGPKLPTFILGLQGCLIILEGFSYGLPHRTRPKNRRESYRTHGTLEVL